MRNQPDAGAADLVTSADRAARLLAEQNEIFRRLKAEVTAAHFEHLLQGG